MAYEWQFNSINDYNNRMGGGSGTMTTDQIKISNDLKKLFPTYLNSLGLKKSNQCNLWFYIHGKLS